MSGVPYGTGIDNDLTDYADATGQGAAKMLDTLENNADRFDNSEWNKLRIREKIT